MRLPAGQVNEPSAVEGEGRDLVADRLPAPGTSSWIRARSRETTSRAGGLIVSRYSSISAGADSHNRSPVRGWRATGLILSRVLTIGSRSWTFASWQLRLQDLEITYGNWLTHGSQVENEQATACVRAALDAGITTFDTADVYANTKAETVLGEALKGERRESLEIFTKVFGPTGPKGHNDLGLSRKHIMEAANGSLSRLQTDYIDLYQAHRYDYETPLEETMQAFADLVRQGKVLYVGVSEWTAEQLRAGHALAKELGFQLISNQPQYSMLWRVIEAEVVPTSQELGISQVVWSPIAQGVLTGQVPARASSRRRARAPPTTRVART